MEERYIKPMEPWMEKILNEYCSDGGKKLHDMADRIIRRNFIWLEQQYYDECYSIANELIYKLLFTHDQTKPFAGYLYSCLSNKIMSAITKTNTNSRRTKIEVEVEVEEDGEVKKKKKKIPIADIYMDVPIGEDGTNTMRDLFASDYDLEKELLGENWFLIEGNYDNYSSIMQEYLLKLSKVQIKILEFMIKGHSKEEIVQLLHIDLSLYKDSIEAITSFKNTRKIEKLIWRSKNVR